MPTRLFLDFGTAYCKAATCKRGKPPAPLAIGKAVRQGRGDRHMIRTALFVSQSGSVYFGEAAVDTADSEERLPYDDIKDVLTGAKHRNELDETLPDTDNPTSVRLTKRHAITLFLAFFTQAALRARRAGKKKVRRSIAMPVFEKDKHQWVSKELTKGLEHAHVLARHFGDNLFKSVDLAEAVGVLEANTERPQVVANPPTVAEPVAAVAGHLLHFTPDGSTPPGLMMVVDVGAGTTDIAMFAKGEVEEAQVTMRHVEGSKVSLRWAGKAIDRALVDHLVDKGRGERGEDRLKANLQRERNGEPIKEDIFRDGRVIRHGVSSSLENFLQSEAMSEVVTKISNGFNAVLLNVDRSFFDRTVVVRFSGGGHDLPFMKRLVQPEKYLSPSALHQKRTRIQMRRANQEPQWWNESDFSDLYKKIGGKFHRMAVALGGAHYCADSHTWLRLQEDMSWLGKRQGPTRSISQ